MVHFPRHHRTLHWARTRPLSAESNAGTTFQARHPLAQENVTTCESAKAQTKNLMMVDWTIPLVLPWLPSTINPAHQIWLQQCGTAMMNRSVRQCLIVGSMGDCNLRWPCWIVAEGMVGPIWLIIESMGPKNLKYWWIIGWSDRGCNVELMDCQMLNCC